MLVVVCACGGEDGAPQPPPIRTVSSLDELAALRRVSRIEGDLELTGKALSGELSLPMLNEVTGTLRVHDDALSTLALPALRRVGSLEISNSPLASLALPALTGAVTLDIAYADALSALDVGALEAVTMLNVGPAIERLALPSLRDLGDLWFRSGTLSLATLEAPVLTHCHSIAAFEADALTSVALPSLTTVDYTLSFRSGALVSLSLPALVYVHDLSAVLGDDAQVELDALEDAVGLTLFSSGALDVQLASLRTVYSLSAGHLFHGSGPPGTTVAIPSLLVADWLALDVLRGALELPALERVGELSANGAELESLSAPSLRQAGSLSLSGAALSQLTLPALTSAGRVRVPLSQLGCDVPALFPELSDAERVVDRDGSCP